MKILDTYIYEGRNVFSHKPCVRLIIDIGGYEEVETKDILNFNERLIEGLPGLKKHACSTGREGGFLDRLKEGTYIPHVFEHMLIEMQNVLGFINIKYGKARIIKDSLYLIVCQYELKEAVICCAKLGEEFINRLLNNEYIDMKKKIEDMRRTIVPYMPGTTTKALIDEAASRGLPFIRIGRGSLYQIGYGSKQKRIQAALCDKTSCIGVDVSCDKMLTKEILLQNNLPAVPAELAYKREEVLSKCNVIGYPVVIKPVDGNQGRGVSVNITRDADALSAFDEGIKVSHGVMIEKYIKGRDFRILVVGGKVAAVAERVPPSVIGDGKRNILELIEKENENPRRGYDHERPMTRISIDRIMISYIEKQGMNLSYVPAQGEEVKLRFNANLSTGGISRDCTDIIHPDNKKIAVLAAEAVGLDIAGVDFCTEDISRSMYEIGGAIIEVNAAPGIRMHMYPEEGTPRNAAASIIDHVFEKDFSSIPVVSITGTNGKTTVTRLVSHIAAMTGKRVGTTSTGGVYVSGRALIKGDTTGPESARMILMRKDIDVAVLETARGGIVRRGLGYDLADVGVITNVSEDHLGIDGIGTLDELASVKSMVIEAVRKDGYSVINACDNYAEYFCSRAAGSIILFSDDDSNELLISHIKAGGWAVYLSDGCIYSHKSGEKVAIADVKDIPMTMGGAIPFNIENALAASAACIGLNIDEKVIGKGLMNFVSDNNYNKGRLNVYDFKNFKVILDYGHNPAAYRAMIKSLQNLKQGRLVGVIGVPGDRLDSSIIESGKIAGEGFDRIIIKEDVDKRGRKDGEVAGLLKRGAVLSSSQKGDISIILNEGDALRYAMETAQKGDTIVVFFENYETVFSEVMKTAHKLLSAEVDRKANII